MANSVHLDKQGPDWPLGFIKVVTPGTPVSVMSLVDAANVNDPATKTPGTAGTDEYTVRAQQIMFQGFKPSGAGFAANTGLVYITRKAAGGSGNRSDPGVIVAILSPSQTIFLASAPLNRNVFSPYRYFIDADNANDGAVVMLLIQ